MNWKFRGMRKDGKEWVEGDLVHNAVNAYSYRIPVGIQPDGSYPLEVISETVGVFTGLLDKNGKEIFEGDVCTYLATSMSDMEIIFENGCFMGKGPFNTLPLKDYFEAGDFESIEIIGSVHEGDR